METAAWLVGVVRGDKLEATYRVLLGDVTLGELPTPVWMPVWNIERNHLEYLGPDTHPDLPAARAVRMAVALPLALQATQLDDGYWLDGGIVDILPAQPFIDNDVCDVAIVVNGFYAPGFASDEEPRWRERPLSILHVANQTRTMQHLMLARRSFADLRRAVPDVIELNPVSYDKVHGAGLYGQFLDTADWPGFMTDGYNAAAQALPGSGRRPRGPPDGSQADRADPDHQKMDLGNSAGESTSGGLVVCCQRSPHLLGGA